LSGLRLQQGFSCQQRTETAQKERRHPAGLERKGSPTLQVICTGAHPHAAPPPPPPPPPPPSPPPAPPPAASADAAVASACVRSARVSGTSPAGCSLLPSCWSATCSRASCGPTQVSGSRLAAADGHATRGWRRARRSSRGSPLVVAARRGSLELVVAADVGGSQLRAETRPATAPREGSARRSSKHESSRAQRPSTESNRGHGWPVLLTPKGGAEGARGTAGGMLECAGTLASTSLGLTWLSLRGVRGSRGSSGVLWDAASFRRQLQ
jgi:hypothetical protein